MFVQEAFLGNTDLIRVLLENGWRSFDARPADFMIWRIDLTELLSDKRYDGCAAADDDELEEWLVHLRNFSGTALDALLWRVVLEVQVASLKGEGGASGRADWGAREGRSCPIAGIWRHGNRYEGRRVHCDLHPRRTLDRWL